MDYEIVQLNDKKVVGMTVRTSNSDKSMLEKINDLWKKFYAGGVYNAVSNKKNGCIINLYSNYESDVNGYYDDSLCCEVLEFDDLSTNTERKIIHGGKYAKFVVRGNINKVVAEFWAKLWKMNLDRKYDSDFEEYKNIGNMEDCEIHIYIGLN